MSHVNELLATSFSLRSYLVFDRTRKYSALLSHKSFMLVLYSSLLMKHIILNFRLFSSDDFHLW